MSKLRSAQELDSDLVGVYDAKPDTNYRPDPASFSGRVELDVIGIDFDKTTAAARQAFRIKAAPAGRKRAKDDPPGPDLFDPEVGVGTAGAAGGVY